jgi:DNA-binding NtrC family response regulator
MHPVNVLVVDDEPLICWALKRRFSGRHMSVHVVGNFTCRTGTDWIFSRRSKRSLRKRR